MKIVKNGIEIEYNENLLDKIRKATGKAENAFISDEEIINFFATSIQVAIDKGIGIIE